MKTLCTVCALLLLSACGGGGSSYSFDPPPVSPPVTPPAPPVDAFFKSVTSYLVSSAENTDATPIDTVVATQPDNTEPSEFM